MLKTFGDRKAKELPLTSSALSSGINIEESTGPSLPHFYPEGQSDNIPRIESQTLLGILDGQYNKQFDNKLIIDCRFAYEYDGGHINSAINFSDQDLLVTHCFGNPTKVQTLIVVYCEYSVYRAPLMARHIRAEDRNANCEHYPRLTYPEIYILEGGYRGFFEEYRSRCHPQVYVEMSAPEHKLTCEREMERLRRKRKGPKAAVRKMSKHAIGGPKSSGPTAFAFHGMYFET